MMQPCALAAKLRGGGSILVRGAKAMSAARHTTTSVHHLRCVTDETVAETLTYRPARRSLCDDRAEHDALWDLAGCHQPPQGDQQLAGEGKDHRLAGGGAAVGGARLEPFDQGAPSGSAETAKPIAACCGAPGHCRHAPSLSRDAGRRSRRGPPSFPS